MLSFYHMVYGDPGSICCDIFCGIYSTIMNTSLQFSQSTSSFSRGVLGGNEDYNAYEVRIALERMRMMERRFIA